MTVGDCIYTPCFCLVYVEAIYLSETLLRNAGYEVPTYYQHPRYIVLGKSIDATHMVFAAGIKTD